MTRFRAAIAFSLVAVALAACSPNSFASGERQQPNWKSWGLSKGAGGSGESR